MLLCRYNRLADDVRKVRADGVIPIHSHQAECGTSNETSADTKEPTQNSNDKADNSQINRVDVRVGNWEKHRLFQAAAQKAKQERRHTIQKNGLPDDEQKGYTGIDVAVLTFEPVQPVPQEIKNQKEVDNDKNRIDCQLNGKGSKVSTATSMPV